MQRIISYSLMLFLFCTGLSWAQSRLTQKKEVHYFINYMVKKQGFNRASLYKLFDKVELQPAIIEAMEKPYEKKNWDQYKTLFLTQKRLEEGLQFWEKNKDTLAKVEKRYGVPAAIIVSILGVETNYGKQQGNYRVIDALSTLSFNYPKRAPYFTRELEQYLILCREQKVDPLSYKGSYAGAIGMAQFMPSNYRYYAIDYRGKGKKDLVNNEEDAIASIGNFLHKHGWRSYQGVAQPAKVANSSLRHIDINARTAKYSTKQLEHLGVVPVTAALNQPYSAGVIELITQEGKEHWLAYHNFYVITRYNTSPQYALAVYLLGQQMKMQWANASTRTSKAYV